MTTGSSPDLTSVPTADAAQSSLMRRRARIDMPTKIEDECGGAGSNCARRCSVGQRSFAPITETTGWSHRTFVTTTIRIIVSKIWGEMSFGGRGFHIQLARS